MMVIYSRAEMVLAAVLDHLEMVCDRGDGGPETMELVLHLIELIGEGLNGSSDS